MVDRPQQVPPDTEQIQDDPVDGQEALGVRDGREASHLAFALARWLV